MATDVTTLSSWSFDEEIMASEVPVLVEVGAAWCPPCRAMQPVLTSISDEFGDRLRVFTVDADADPGIVARFAVAGVPTLLVFRDGQVVKRLVGARSKRRLAEDLADVVS